MSGTGKPSELHPRKVAVDLGLPVQSGPVEWHDLLDAACRLYWDRRPEQSRAALVEYQRRKQRQRLSPEVWLRRGAA